MGKVCHEFATKTYKKIESSLLRYAELYLICSSLMAWSYTRVLTTEPRSHPPIASMYAAGMFMELASDSPKCRRL